MHLRMNRRTYLWSRRSVVGTAWITLGLLTLMLGFPPHSLHAQSTLNVGLHAVPAPGPVTIDGKLDDWDLSGSRLMCYDVSSLRGRYSAEVAMMYDAACFYVSLRWKDPTPMVNYYDPKLEPGWGWRSDCVQLRMKTDRVAHIDGWYYTKTGQPAMSIHYGAFSHGPEKDPDTAELPDALAAGAREAFVKDPDGKGYVQEMAIPWKLLARDGHALKAGETLICGVELLWGRDSGRDFYVHRFADNVSEQARSGAIFFWMGPQAWGKVMLEPKGKLTLPPQIFQGDWVAEPAGPIALPFNLRQPGYVTLAIDDTNGRRVRTLLKEMYFEAGRHEAHWDGADDTGHVLPPQRYAWKGLLRDTLHVDFALAYNNPGDPPWDTAERTSAWLSDHVNPTSVAADNQQVYINCPGVESGWAPIALGLDGRKRWGSREAGIGIATDSGVVFSVTDPGGPRDLKPGQKAKVDIVVTRLSAADGGYAPFDNPELPSGGVKATVYHYEAEANNIYEFDADRINLQGAAARGGLLCLSLQLDNLIRVVDGKTSKLVKNVPVPAPKGLAFAKDGMLYVVSARQVLQVNLTSGDIRPVVKDGLEDPQQICLGPNGELIVSDRGASQQVKVFSSDGKFMRAIGRPGGRALLGSYDPLGFQRPRGVALDAQARLWVAEDSDTPRRISVWSLEGNLVREFVGPGYYSGGGLLDPADKTRAYYHNMEYQLDYKTGGWKLVRLVAGGFGPESLAMRPGTGHPNRIVHHRGQAYLVSSSQGGAGLWTVARRRADGVFQPLAAAGLVGKLADDGPSAFRGKDKTLRFSWSDANADGLVQTDELTWAPSRQGKNPEIWGVYWSGDVRDDLTLVVPAGNEYYGMGGMGIWNFPVTGWTKCGAPMYDVANPVVQVAAVPSTGLTSIMALKDGSVVINAQPVQCYGPDGTLRWTFPNPDLNPYDCGPLRPGKLLGPQAFLGRVDMGRQRGEILMLNGYNGSRFLITADGLWLGHVFNDGRNGPESLPRESKPGFRMDDMTCGGESFNGSFIRTADGKIYTLTGQTESRVVEVKGLETIRRIAGFVTVTPELYAQAVQHLAAVTASNTAAKSEFVIAGGPAPAIDGDLSDWDMAAGVAWRANPVRGARVAARHDGKKLYLAFQVDDSNPMVNAGKNPYLLFKTGDGVDLWLGTDKTAPPERGAPVPGDIRLLFSVMEGKPVAVLYEAVVPGTQTPIPFSSPARTVKIDRVRLLDDAVVSIRREVAGYVIEAAVPLATLGLKPEPAVLKGDVGVIYSDTTGTKNELRSYWSNKTTGIVMDIPDESMFIPSRWGSVIVK